MIYKYLDLDRMAFLLCLATVVMALAGCHPPGHK